jgi:hypothetical protein
MLPDESRVGRGTSPTGYFSNTDSKNVNARGSRDCPSQNIACLRTAAFEWLRATSMSRGTPSSAGSWLSAKTACRFTAVSGSRARASSIAPTDWAPARCASQKSAWLRACGSGAVRASAIVAVSAG